MADREVYAQAFVRARFLRKAGGALSAAEVIEGLGAEDIPRDRMPAWVQDWADSSSLPATKAPAPSVWG